MLALVPWIIALWLRQSRQQRERLATTRSVEDAIRPRHAARFMTGKGATYERSAYVEQSTGNPALDDQVRRLKVEALHEFKNHFARRPGHRA